MDRNRFLKLVGAVVVTAVGVDKLPLGEVTVAEVAAPTAVDYSAVSLHIQAHQRLLQGAYNKGILRQDEMLRTYYLPAIRVQLNQRSILYDQVRTED